jgi:hypothetical protein
MNLLLNLEFTFVSGLGGHNGTSGVIVWFCVVVVVDDDDDKYVEKRYSLGYFFASKTYQALNQFQKKTA